MVARRVCHPNCNNVRNGPARNTGGFEQKAITPPLVRLKLVYCTACRAQLVTASSSCLLTVPRLGGGKRSGSVAE